MRDFQRARVYRAQQHWRGGDWPLNQYQARELTERICRRHRVSTPQVVVAAVSVASYLPGVIRITDPVEAWVVAHEIAHHAAATRGKPESAHGPRFCRWFVRIVEREFGYPSGTRLAAAFEAVGVVF